MEIHIVGEDDYKYEMDEIEMVTIRNKLGDVFEFRPEEMKSIELVFPKETTH